MQGAMLICFLPLFWLAYHSRLSSKNTLLCFFLSLPDALGSRSRPRARFPKRPRGTLHARRIENGCEIDLLFTLDAYRPIELLIEWKSETQLSTFTSRTPGNACLFQQLF